jgi:hypothetical protein
MTYLQSATIQRAVVARGVKADEVDTVAEDTCAVDVAHADIVNAHRRQLTCHFLLTDEDGSHLLQLTAGFGYKGSTRDL